MAVIGLGVGPVLGAALFGVLAFSGSPAWGSYPTVENVIRSTAEYSLIGGLVALVAIVGGWVLVAVFDRRFEKRPCTRVLLAGIGAAAGTVFLGLAVAIPDSIRNPTGTWMVLGVITLVLAIAAAVVAAYLVSWAERVSLLRTEEAVSSTPGGR